MFPLTPALTMPLNDMNTIRPCVGQWTDVACRRCAKPKTLASGQGSVVEPRSILTQTPTPPEAGPPASEG